MRPFRAPVAAVAVCWLGVGLPSAAGAATSRPAPAVRPHVVVATLDTGTNPFHPVWRRAQQRHPSTFLPGYPRSARAARLTLAGSFDESVERSEQALASFQGGALTWIPGTNIIGTWAHSTDKKPIFDASTKSAPSHSHGASASSQIAGRGIGTSPDAWLVVMDRTSDSGQGVAQSNADGLRWAADQPWIDIIHTNIQNVIPLANQQVAVSPGFADAVKYAVSKGKLVVSAGGNFYAEPTETSPHAGPPGVLAAGANDNCGFSDYSNPNPHVVMDGMGTVSADPVGFGFVPFSGTSSASPRISGYVAEVLLQVRRHFGYPGGVQDGALVVVPAGRRPAAGPLADGRLTAAELHEVVRKTANPRSHASKYDGTGGTPCVPDVPTGPAFYPKVGYGEVSEHTLPAAVDVLLGRQPQPARPDEDRFYEASERARATFWK